VICRSIGRAFANGAVLFETWLEEGGGEDAGIEVERQPAR